MSTRLDCALALARLGYRIFPLRPGSKEPYRKEGWKAIMTTDEARITQWFAERTDMNYAVVCDPYHVILDPDEGLNKQGRKKQGVANFRRAEEEALGFVEDSIFDNTLRVRTPKGGVHLYFNAEHGYANSAGTIIPDVDVRGPDGYVVGPECATFDDPEHNTVEGTYVIESDASNIADLPSWLKQKLETGGTVGQRASNAGSAAHAVDTPHAIETACRLLRERKPALEGESGDHHTVMTAMALKDYGVSEDKAFELIFGKILFAPDRDHPEGRSWNDMCEPPWEFDDLRTKVHNAYKYGNRQIGSKMDALSSVGEEVAAPAVDGMDSMQASLAPGEHYSAISQPIGVSDEAERIKSAIFTPGDFIERKVNVESIFPEWIPAFGVTATLAKRGTGKSVFLTDLCMRIVTDTAWNGIQPAADWAAVYLCGEDDSGLQRNIAAWKALYNKFPGAERLLIADRVPNLMNADDVKTWAEELKKRFQGRRVVVFVDTWQRATSNASQNDDKEMQKAIHQAEGLARFLDGCAIIAFHPPKGRDDTITGSMVLENSTTAILAITSTGANERHVEVMRIKGPGEGHYAKFNIEGKGCCMMDEQGSELTGALPIYKGGNKEGPAQEKIDYNERIRKIIADMLAHVLPERKKGVSFKEVAQMVVSVIMNDPEGEVGKFFNRAKRVDEVQKMLPLLFNAATVVELGRGAFMTCVNEHLKIA